MDGVKTIEAARIRAQGIKLQPTAALSAADANRCADLLYALADELEAALRRAIVAEHAERAAKERADTFLGDAVRNATERDSERARVEKAEAELAKERGRAARLEESMSTLAEQISTNTHPDEVQISSPARHIMGQRILLGLDQWRREHGATVGKADD